MKNLKKSIEIAAAADLRLAIWGRHGVGKTAIVEQLSEEGYYVKTIILSQSDPLVLGGYPGREQIGVDEFGNPIMATVFAKPQWLIDLEAAVSQGLRPILFFDEFNRADKYAHDTAMRLVNEKSINGYNLPSNTVILAAMNPETENDNALNALTDPMIDRWCHIAVYTDVAHWLGWAETDDNVDPLVASFIKTNHDALSVYGMDGLFEEQVLQFIGPTQRSTDAVSRVIKHLRDWDVELPKAVNDPAVFNILKGLVGTEIAGGYVSFVQDNFYQPFTVQEMLKPTKKVLKKADELREKNLHQVIVTSLQTAREEIPALIKNPDIKNLEGFFTFLIKAPVDVQNSFWYGDNENQAYWTGILAMFDDDPL
ncbi:MAG: hypothetical protein R3309_13135, partial [Reinekea sp.]|nr:hypothetical protein [Reinekea sp.]